MSPRVGPPDTPRTRRTFFAGMCSVSRVRPPGSPRTRRHFFRSGFQSVRSATGLSPLDSAHRWHELCARAAHLAPPLLRGDPGTSRPQRSEIFEIWLFFRGSKNPRGAKLTAMGVVIVNSSNRVLRSCPQSRRNTHARYFTDETTTNCGSGYPFGRGGLLPMKSIGYQDWHGFRLDLTLLRLAPSSPCKPCQMISQDSERGSRSWARGRMTGNLS